MDLISRCKKRPFCKLMKEYNLSICASCFTRAVLINCNKLIFDLQTNRFKRVSNIRKRDTRQNKF